MLEWMVMLSLLRFKTKIMNIYAHEMQIFCYSNVKYSIGI